MNGFRQEAEDYISMRRALGFKFALQGRLVIEFAGYLEDIGATQLTTAAALSWATKPAGADPAWWNQRLAVARGFARHLHNLDPATQVPPPTLLSGRFRRATPYLYSPADIDALMAATAVLRHPLRRATYRAVIGLLAVSGMRIGEAIRLDRSDVDWPNGLVVVRASKFGRSREVPLHPTTVDALKAYARERDRLQPKPRPASFFVSHVGARLVYRSACSTFRRLVDTAALNWERASRPPRLHDLRHSFCVQTLVDWYRDDDLDAEALMPRLSTYVGHTKPVWTYWYLEAAPELLGLAAGRLERARRKQT
jgi:integrase/recombinase XerD